MDFNTLCVLGLGYIGLPTASTFATHGLNVIGVDTNPQIVNALNNGKLHLHEPGLRTLVQAALRSGKLSISQHAQPADAFIIAVPTPFDNNKKADLSFIISAAEAIAKVLVKGNLVILESTSPPLTTRNIVAPILEKSGLKTGADFFLAYSPERVLPGQILQELIENARVIGGFDSLSAQAGMDLYKIFVCGEIILTDSTTAEMVKLMENTYRDVNIAIANEFSQLADHFKIDVWEAIQIANHHPRVNILNPGPGVGGHCISVDPWFLVGAAPEITPLIRTAREVNDSQPEFVVKKIKQIFKGSLKGRRIAALGLAYKPDVDDLRESPAVEIINQLVNEGAMLTAYEPFKKGEIINGIGCTDTLEEAVKDAELILLMVAHTSLINILPEKLARLTPARLVFDAVNIWDTSKWKKVGFSLFRLGVGKEITT